MKLREKKEKLVKYQEEKNLFVWERDGTTFVYVRMTPTEERSMSAEASSQGVKGSYSTAKEGTKYDCIVFRSGSSQPLPYEKWRELAGSDLTAASGGEALPEQLGEVSFSTSSVSHTTSATLWRQVVKPDLDYVLTHVRQGIVLYRRGPVPDMLDIGLVTPLANTSMGNDFQPVYHPISEAEVMEALHQMERDGEIRIEGDKIRFLH